MSARCAVVAAALAWSVGFLVGGLGIATSQLWLLYLGYGVIGGIRVAGQGPGRRLGAPMIQDFFRGGSGDSGVDPAAAAGFVGVLSICTMVGASCGPRPPTRSAASA